MINSMQHDLDVHPRLAVPAFIYGIVQGLMEQVPVLVGTSEKPSF